MDFLHKLLHGAGQVASGVGHALTGTQQVQPQQPQIAEHGPPLAGSFVPNITRGMEPIQPLQQMQQDDPAFHGYPPDITFNPNPNTNIPYSAHTPALAKLGNQYVADPTNPRFLNVDPAQFGFPPDNTTRRRY